MIVVSDTTPLIGLAIINQFELLHHLFGKIYIPPQLEQLHRKSFRLSQTVIDAVLQQAGE